MWRAVLAALLLGECAVFSQGLATGAGRLRNSVILDLDHAEQFEMRGSMEMGDTEHGQQTVTLSPEERARAHRTKFEAEFVVELNMTHAHDRGAKLGITLNRNADFEAATIHSVSKNGLIEEWNQAHPGKDVHVGDEVVQVNDIQWHANAETFMNRIKGQFVSARKQVDGASDILRLYIQRPRVWKHKRFALQREDLHDRKYAAEFVAKISVGDIMDEKKYSAKIVEKYASEIVADLMGWKLGMKRREEWMPATIRRVERHGALAMWNKKHEDQLILEGDEILKVDDVIWQHNSTTFLKNLKRHFKTLATLATETRNSSWSVVLSIRRPRLVQTAFDETHYVQEIVSESWPNTSVVLRFNRTHETDIPGWKLSPGAKSATGVEGPVLVEKVQETGLVAKWNAENPNNTIHPNDQIVTLNGIKWDKYASSYEFYNAVLAALTCCQPAVRLTLERPVQIVRSRHNETEAYHGKRAL